MTQFSKWRVLAVSVVFGLVGLTAAHAAIQVVGAGATFPAPVYTQWAEAYYKVTGVEVNYQPVGTGAGIQQIDAKIVDFGASDMPQTDEVLAKKGGIQFPTVMGGVVPVVNIKGINAGEIRLTGALLADIYAGKIKKWNDPALLALNPSVKLPDAAITVVHRADGSGTTFIFTNYLSKVSPEWKSTVGDGTAVNWPKGVGGKGNEGVAAFVSRLPNSIGYVEYAYVAQNGMKYVKMENADGNGFLIPSAATFKAAAAGADWKKSFYQILTNRPGNNAWPISGATFILLNKVNDKPQKTEQVLKFFKWVYADGYPQAEKLHYITMPKIVVKEIEALWAKELKTTEGKALYK